MNFEILTYVPIDLDAILPEKMSTEEKEMLNHYHKQVYESVPLPFRGRTNLAERVHAGCEVISKAEI